MSTKSSIASQQTSDYSQTDSNNDFSFNIDGYLSGFSTASQESDNENTSNSNIYQSDSSIFNNKPHLSPRFNSKVPLIPQDSSLNTPPLTPTKYAKAFEWLMYCCKKNDYDALFLVGELFQTVMNAQRFNELAIVFYRKSSVGNNAEQLSNVQVVHDLSNSISFIADSFLDAVIIDCISNNGIRGINLESPNDL